MIVPLTLLPLRREEEGACFMVTICWVLLSHCGIKYLIT